MKIIDNISTNHNIRIQKMLLSANHLFLVSPFLMEDFEEFIHDLATNGIKKVTLITTLQNNTSDLFRKVNTIYSFCISCMLNNIEYEIRVDNLLHGKIYIALEDDIPVSGIVTSAKFIIKGLSINHEWGIEINDSKLLKGIIDDLFKVCSEPLKQDELDSIVKEIDSYIKKNPIVKEEKPTIDVIKHIKNKLPILEDKTRNFDTDVRYFLKPVGSTNDPFDENWVLNPGVQEMQFSKRRPSSVRRNDILICYGVGSTKLLGYFKVLSDPYYDDSDSSRWPWKVEIENLSPTYSQVWSSKNNTLSYIRTLYGEEKVLTYAGGKTLGALQFGADRVQLNLDFANFLMNLIDD